MSSAQAVEFFNLSQLPATTLSEIWTLCQRSAAGSLSFDEFLISTKLIEAARSGSPLPPALPQALLDTFTASRNPSAAAIQQHQPLGGRPTLAQVPAGEKIHYLSLWAKLSPPSGKLGALEAKQLFEKSGLSQYDLNEIWTMADSDRDMCLSQEEFVIAMYLLDLRRSQSQLQQPQSHAGDHTTAAIAALHSSISSLQSSVSSATQDSSRLSAQAQEANAQLTKLQAEHASLQAQASQLQATCQEKKHQLESVQSNVKALESSLSFERQRVEGLKTAVMALEKEAQDAMAHFSGAQAEFTSNSGAVAQLSARKEQLDQHLAQQRQQIGSNEQEIQKLQQMLASQSEMAANYQAMIMSQNAAREQMQHQFLSQNQQLEALSQAATHGAESINQQPSSNPSAPASPPPAAAFSAASPPLLDSLLDIPSADSPVHPGKPVAVPFPEHTTEQPPAPPPRLHLEEVNSDGKEALHAKEKRKSAFHLFGKKSSSKKGSNKESDNSSSSGSSSKEKEKGSSKEKEKKPSKEKHSSFKAFGADKKDKHNKQSPSAAQQVVSLSPRSHGSPVVHPPPFSPSSPHPAAISSGTLDLSSIDFSATAAAAPPPNPFLSPSSTLPSSLAAIDPSSSAAALPPASAAAFGNLFTAFQPMSEEPFVANASANLFVPAPADSPNPFAAAAAGPTPDNLFSADLFSV